ncbi:MAG: PLP-dependent transferase [Citrobacter freundii]|nr:PLP-dependent transferase [Citrobacter freundii]MDU1436763.1 PLP-dependent transferase [Citrobacter freundii]
MDSVHHIWCPLSSQEYQDLPDGAETTLTENTGLIWIETPTNPLLELVDIEAVCQVAKSRGIMSCG